MLRDFTQSLADRTRARCGCEPLGIPDLGLAALGDQLTVVVYDAQVAGVTDGLLESLAQLRRSLP
ncbi:hypothetical protein [Rudaeicoccus suwonensis]|uniref:hypothetical protein n=1 Tax=Rudaeicoccus suwonensis TaxID=657409 RepID=UPI00119D2DA1|nr:hypothetical protein [Rudaeicoccus suwonensis]